MAGDEESGRGDNPATWFQLPEEGPDDPRPIVRRLVEEEDLFRDLRVGEAVIMAVFRAFPLVKQARTIIGTMALPRWQGSMGPMAEWLLATACGGIVPDFILTIDLVWWNLAGPREREALVFHELCHCMHAVDKDGELRFTDDGLPVWAIRGHDLEEFRAVVEKYGAWDSDIAAFAESLRKGGVR